LLFAVTDFKVGVFDIDLGLGFGMTSGNGILEKHGQRYTTAAFQS